MPAGRHFPIRPHASDGALSKLRIQSFLSPLSLFSCRHHQIQPGEFAVLSRLTDIALNVYTFPSIYISAHRHGLCVAHPLALPTKKPVD